MIEEVAMTDIYDEIKTDQVEVGDYVRVVTLGSPPTLLEGAVNYVHGSLDAFDVGDSSYFEASIESAQVDTIHRRREPLDLPTTVGSAVLLRNGNVAIRTTDRAWIGLKSHYTEQYMATEAATVLHVADA